jgi:hypothetical protein
MVVMITIVHINCHENGYYTFRMLPCAPRILPGSTSDAEISLESVSQNKFRTSKPEKV